MRKIIVTFCLLIVADTASAQIPSKAPALALKDIRGRTLRLSDFKGKVVLANFWATWCPPCRAEIPELIKWQRVYRDLGLQIVGITYPPQKLREVRRFVRTMKVNYPIVFGTKNTKLIFDPGETLPLTVVIDRDGVVRGVIQGILLPEEFEEKVVPLLSQPIESKRIMHLEFSMRASRGPTITSQLDPLLPLRPKHVYYVHHNG